MAHRLLWFRLYEQASGKINGKSLASPDNCGAEPCLKSQMLFGAASEKTTKRKKAEFSLSFFGDYPHLCVCGVCLGFFGFFPPQVPVLYFAKCTSLQKGGPWCSMMEPCMLNLS